MRSEKLKVRNAGQAFAGATLVDLMPGQDDTGTREGCPYGKKNTIKQL